MGNSEKPANIPPTLAGGNPPRTPVYNLGRMRKRAQRRRPRIGKVEAGKSPSRPERFSEARRLSPIVPKMQKQGDYLRALRASEHVVAIGCAGVGKTWIAATHAATLLREVRVAKIVLTKPDVPGGRGTGLLLGSADEKMAPWVTPLTEAIEERIGGAAFEIAQKRGDGVVPIETMRGRTFKNCFVILSETQKSRSPPWRDARMA